MDDLKNNLENIEKTTTTSTEVVVVNKTKNRNIIRLISASILLIVVCIFYLSSPNRDRDFIIHISPNDSLSTISERLETNNVIRNQFIFKSVLRFFYSDKHIISGDYLFKKNEGIFGIVSQLVLGKHGIEKIKVTFKEGITNEEMANILAENIPSFDKKVFLSDERAKEGYLFPDTYFFYPMTTADEALNELTSNFNKKIRLLDNEIKSSGKSVSDIITMASILEKEAKGERDAYTISGILWKRIKIGMALQVDAAPVTYKKSGLPDSPICNPGLISIKAAIKPESSPYLYYLHDDSGQVHYAMDFSEHRSNIAHYLK